MDKDDWSFVFEVIGHVWPPGRRQDTQELGMGRRGPVTEVVFIRYSTGKLDKPEMLCCLQSQLRSRLTRRSSCWSRSGGKDLVLVRMRDDYETFFRNFPIFVIAWAE